MEKDITHYYYLEDMLYVDCTKFPKLPALKQPCTKQQVLNMEKDITHYYYLEDMLYVDCTIRPGETFVCKLWSLYITL